MSHSLAIMQGMDQYCSYAYTTVDPPFNVTVIDMMDPVMSDIKMDQPQQLAQLCEFSS